MDVGERYLEVVLGFRRLSPSLVESYVGPAELAAEIEARPMPSYPQVAQQARDLIEELEQVETDQARVEWLGAQLAGIEAACARLAGEPVAYRELTKRCHGVTACEVDEAQFEHAHELIARVLPGGGSLRERFAGWRASQLVCGQVLVDGLRALLGEFRGRSHARWDLPEDERVVLQLTRGRPWAGYAEYCGSLQTVVQINDELPIAAWRMVELVAHEAYPGHHTEHVCKATVLGKRQGRKEFDVWVYPTPQVLIAEGIAMLAPEILLGEEIEEVGAAVLRPLGIDYDTDVSAAVRRAHELLLPMRANLAIMLDEDRIDRVGIREYLRRWRLEDNRYIERIVAGLCERHWPPYESCYPEGHKLCGRFVGGDLQRFGQLLRQQLTPQALLRARSE
jgi:hypothetical protein